MSLLHRAEKIRSSIELCVQKSKRLRYIFCNNRYPDWYTNNTIKKFEKRQNNPPNKSEPNFHFTIGIPFVLKTSRVFAKRLTALVKTKFIVDIDVYYACFKSGSYFNLSVLFRFLYCLMSCRNFLVRVIQIFRTSRHDYATSWN